MGVWLKSTGRVFAVRDGRSASDPVLAVGPTDPVWLANLDREAFRRDTQLVVIDKPAPTNGYKAPTWAEYRDNIKRQRKPVMIVEDAKPKPKPTAKGPSMRRGKSKSRKAAEAR